jgi:hypothetical protein
MPLHLPADFVHQFEEKSPFGSAGTAVAMAFAANSRLLALGGSDLPLAGPDPLCAPLLSALRNQRAEEHMPLVPGPASRRPGR